MSTLAALATLVVVVPTNICHTRNTGTKYSSSSCTTATLAYYNLREKTMQYKFSMTKLKRNNRVDYLYRTVYRQQCKGEGFSGSGLRAEGLKRAKAHYKEENKRVQEQATAKPASQRTKDPQVIKIIKHQ
jgi:hypothetical protein